MYKYKIMIIDDEIESRINYLSDFFSNSPLDTNSDLTHGEKELLREEIAVEFGVIYPKGHEILEEYVKENKVDAYFLDVYLEKCSDWSLNNALSAISKYNPRAPIFMYSTDWRDKNVLTTVTQAFRNCFPGKTATYFYELNTISGIVKQFKRAKSISQIANIKRERKFIKDMIVKAYGKTEKDPFSPKGDIAILHISDIQYGDKNMTKYEMGLWQEVVRVCKDLKRQRKISGIDLLVITGDVSMNGKDVQLKEAQQKLEQCLFKKLWEEEFDSKEYQERILVVPGNHDFDLNFCVLDYFTAKNGPNKGDRKVDFGKVGDVLQNVKRKKRSNTYKTMGFTAYKEFAYDITGNPIYHQKKHLNYVEERFTSWKIRFICLNTCEEISAYMTNGVGIDKEELSEIINGNYDDDCYTIVLSHHSPLFAEEWKKTHGKKFEDACKNILTSCRPDLWLGGHRHVQKDEAKSTVLQTTEVFEASTISLAEKWTGVPKYKVQTTDGRTLNSRRGFQIVLLEKNQENTYKPKVIKYVFDQNGIAAEVRE